MTAPRPTPEERYEAALDRVESEEVFLREAMTTAIREAEAAGEARGRAMEREGMLTEVKQLREAISTAIIRTDKESSDD